MNLSQSPSREAMILENAIRTNLPTDRRPTESELLDLAKRFRQSVDVDDAEFEAVIKRLHHKLAITMEQGTALVDEALFTPWLDAKRASLDPYYWDRFRELLVDRHKWPPLVVNSLDRVADEILDLLGDPNRDGTWKRRGLVVGDVQSGKTGTYTALCNKAADAGYRFVILLTGTLEALRRQTQERLDEGFVGLDSAQRLLPGAMKNLLIGVGLLNGERTAGVFTSRSRDFSQQLLTQLGFRLASFKEPVLVVVKKNKRILENLESWLRSYNAGGLGTIDLPVLIIDDEADSASINTNDTSDPNKSPTAINAKINDLLKLFSRSAYVGFTATPFANVFINPETETGMFQDDLFPRDFIYALEPPTNYSGPEAFFGDRSAAFLRIIDDAENDLPAKHKVSFEVDGLPESLCTAVHSFLIANAIRDLRGSPTSHRSMLVNVSRFTSVQNQVARLIDDRLRSAQREIRSFSKLPPSEALGGSDELRKIHALWKRDFYDCGHEWIDVLGALHNAVQPIIVKAVNQSTGSASLDYTSARETGLRVIAVGGNSLSRGLTLEGLSTSYFYRNSQMYDTLLQMGRWFGYRDGYEDLCRLWLADEAEDWYRHITLASDELRNEFKRMRAKSLTPRDFGLKVRAHPDSLLVTARNKMRTSGIIERHVSLSGEGLEAPRLRSVPSVVESNRSAAERLLLTINESGAVREEHNRASALWRGVPKSVIARFLSEFQAHQLNFNFQVDRIAEFLESTEEPMLQNWTVAVPSGNVDFNVRIGGIDIKPVNRFVEKKPEIGAYFISEGRVRVGSGGIEQLGLSETEIATVKNDPRVVKQYAGRQIPDREYRLVRKEPLLLLYAINGRERNETPILPDHGVLISIGLSFPEFDDSGINERVVYRANAVEMRAFLETEADEPEPGDDYVA